MLSINGPQNFLLKLYHTNACNFCELAIFPKLLQVRLDRIPKRKLLGIFGAGLYSGWMPFLSPNHQIQSTEGLQYKKET